MEWNGEDGFKVNQGEDRYIVNFYNVSYTHKRWDLTGIPCAYAIRVLFLEN